MSRVVAQFDPSQSISGDITISLANRCGGIRVRNESAYGLAFQIQDGRILVAGPWEIHDIQIGLPQKTMHWDQVYALAAQGAPVSTVIIEAYEPAEWPPTQVQSLARQFNVGNTVNTGTNVGQVTNVVYDQSAINGEPAGTVKSEAAAGSGAGLVDVTDTNATGGKRIFAMQHASPYIDANGVYQGTANAANSASAVPATGVGAGALPAGVTLAPSQLTAGALPAGVTIPGGQVSGTVANATNATNATNASNIAANATLNNPTVNAGNLNLDNGGSLSPAAIWNDVVNASRAYFQLVSEILTLYTTYRGGANVQAFQLRASDSRAFFGGVVQVPQLSFASGSYGGTMNGISFFSGTGPGTFSHGLSSTPRWIGITTTQAASTETVGVDSIGPTTCKVNTPNNWPWIGVALA